MNDITAQQMRRRVFLIGVMLFSLVIAILFLVFFESENQSIKVESIEKYAAGDLDDLIYAVYMDPPGDREVFVTGWAIKPGATHTIYNYGNDMIKECVYNNMRVAFTDGERVYIMPTKLARRDDVDRLIVGDIDYGYCGFTSHIPSGSQALVDDASLVLIWRDPDGTEELYYL